MNRTLVLWFVVALGCKSSPSAKSAEAPKATSEDRVAPRPAGHCRECNLDVYEGHRCRLTTPCRLCLREHGARHYHETVWRCEADKTGMRATHICNDATYCETCLHGNDSNPRCKLCAEKRHASILSKACEYCSQLTPVVAVRGITVYCATCNLEVGANHIHGKSVFCGACLRESGEGHVHGVTQLCVVHQRDCAIDHEHGRTEYCQACRRDVGLEHKHGDTIWCIRCKVEAPWPHCHHVGP